MDIDIEMASLEINDKKRRNEDSNTADDHSSTVAVRRSLRKRIKPLEVEKRRVLTRPKKCDSNDISAIKNIYLNKKIKRNPSNLETIFEEPKDDKDGDFAMSVKKFKRLINFASTSTTDKQKIKKRHMKAKKLFPCKKKACKVTKDYFLKKLNELEDCDTDKSEGPV